MAKIRNFQDFQAGLRYNPAIPGSEPGETDYMKDAEEKASQELRQRNIGRNAGMEIMQLIDEAQRLQHGHEEEIEDIAEDVIRNQYGSILDNVILDIKLVRQGQVQNETPDSESMEPETPPEMRKLEDATTALEIHKRKIANNIAQGEAKNTHRLIHMPEVRQRLDAINPRLFQIYDRILKLAEYMDWTIPSQLKKNMMVEHPEGMGGMVAVDWQQEPNNDNEIDTEKLLKDLSNSKIEDHEEEIEETFEGGKAVIHARGIDFPMLVHETVKGIYDLIASIHLSMMDEKTAKIVVANADTLEDEIEDQKYGPFIASDLRDFINVNNLVDDFENMREHVYGKIMQLPAADFLELMRGILNRTEEAREVVDEMISEIAAVLRSEQRDMTMGDLFNDEDDSDSEDSDIEDEPKMTDTKAEVETGEDDTLDYSNKSQRDLQKLLDAALDEEDFAKAAEIGKYLK